MNLPPAEDRLTRAAAWMFVALAACAALAALPFRTFDLDRFLVPKELALHIGATVALVLTVAAGAWSHRSRLDTVMVGFLALSALSAAAAPNHWLSARALAISVSGAVAWWAARAIAARGGRDVLIGGLALATVIGAGTALAQAYGVSSDLASLSRAPGGTFGNRNFMAHVAAAGVPLLAYLALTARAPGSAVLAALGLGVNAAALVLSRTRAAWLALVICAVMAVAAWLWRRGTMWRDAGARRGLILLIGGLVLGGAGALVVPNTLDWKSENPYLESAKGLVNFREGSGRGRLKQYANSVRLVVRHPLLGVGPGNWPVEYPGVAPASDPSLSQDSGMTANPWPSSDWMAMLAERGPLAFALWTALLVSLGLAGLRGWGNLGLPLDARLRALCGAALLVVVAVEGAFDAVLLLALPTMLLWGSVGVMLPPGEDAAAVAVPRGRRVVLGIAVLLVGLASAEYSALKIASMNAFNDGQLGRAASLDPGSYRARLRYAQLMLARGSRKRGCEDALAARALFPRSPEAKRTASGCK
ncbi:MAG: O-antigen ligase family protein [Gemmatimonadaceae bacterium]